MHFRIPLVDSVLAMVRNYSGALFDRRQKRGNEAIDKQSETNNDHSQPQKRRKVQSSSCIKSKNINRIIEWLGHNDITTIGIYGMGGVGKTYLATQLQNRVLKNDMPFSNAHAIAWVTVEMGFTVYNLQKTIAAAFDLDLEDDKDENRRAAMLYSYLSRTDNCILFLDDLWADFRRVDVGIPKSCKLIVISRSLDVCHMLHCQKTIKVEPLTEEGSWELFCFNIGGYGVSDSKNVSSLRKFLYDESAGLPPAINVLANSMKGMENDALRWKECSIGRTQMEDILNRLKLSYDRLNNIKLQHCFLYCALYPKGYAISKEELIHIWIREGLIDDVPSSQAQLDMGHTIVNKLLNSSLLEACKDTSSIKMHDLVRRMALFIARDYSEVNSRTFDSLNLDN